MDYGRPTFTDAEARELASAHWGVSGQFSHLASYLGQNFLIATDQELGYILKIAPATEAEQDLDLENQIMLHVEGRLDCGTPVPLPDHSGRLLVQASSGDRSFNTRLFRALPGVPLAEVRPRTRELRFQLGELLGKLNIAMESFEHPATERSLEWDLMNAISHRSHLADLRALPHHRLEILEDAFLELDARLPDMRQLPRSVIHNDANDYNILVETLDGKPPAITGLIDFGDVASTATVAELAIGCTYIALGEDAPLEAAADVVRGYHSVRPLSRPEVEVLFTLIRARLAVSVVSSTRQAEREPENDYLFVSEVPVWELLETLRHVTPREAHEVFAAACGWEPPETSRLQDPEIRHLRDRHLGPSLSLSYEAPLHIVRGRDRYLFDEAGNAHLDLVNNVCHVGHCHPVVVEALVRQAGLLNTNTRYLHENIVEYARRLTAMLPEPLSVCFFVNSGSEANELALRLARAATGRQGIMVVDGGYHGNTNGLVGVSPYKFDGPGGGGAPAHVQVAAMPDRYRGRFRGSEEEVSPRYVEDVSEIVEAAAGGDFPVGAFLAEALLSCGGQIEFPRGYLGAVYEVVRQQGGVCIADEVQIGFGRVGSHFWGFELHDVVPDIVTMGKPIGNGHPLAAVVTTPEIAAAFANGMEYFNTFGGNPVACAVGLAVLDVIETEELQQNALAVGDRLLAGLEQLQKHHALVGDARGKGLFLGIDLVSDRETREPAPTQAREIVERMRNHRLLLSTDGPEHNVIKIKPPITLTAEDADFVVRSLDRELTKLEEA